MVEAPRVRDLPTGTVTFLLTDVEGSTRLWEANAKTMGQALAIHDRIITDAITGHRGTLLKQKGEGDSVFGVFARASDAAAAAIACQRAMASAAWPEGIELRVRIAVHTGEAELRDGDYFGPTVNRTARLRATAHGGQIVMSQAAADLARDQLPDGIATQRSGCAPPAGSGTARDGVRTRHPDLPSSFPPLRSIDAFPGNLPVQLTSFVGRDREMKLIAEGFSSSRLITLTGTGGRG